MAKKHYLVTGGSGFIGSAVARRLLAEGFRVRVLDNNFRGQASRLADLGDAVEFIQADIRDAGAVATALTGVDGVCHLAFVNGTEFFYSQPELVLDVGVRGMINVLDGCVKHGVGELMVASSSEVYQTPPVVPTDETVPLTVPDPLNPRYSYAGGKIISELMALNYGRRHFSRVVVFRPHNVYGPDMGWEHVLPQFVARMKKLCAESGGGPIKFPLQGSGRETRAFNFIEDFVDGLMVLREKGEHLGIYHIGTNEEVSIADVAALVGEFYGREVEIVPGKVREGSVARRCPDISKLAALGYRPRCALADGLPVLARWYDANAGDAPDGLT